MGFSKGHKDGKKRDGSAKGVVIAAAISVAITAITATVCFFLLFGVREKKESVVVPSYVGQRADTIKDSDSFTFEREGIYSDDVAEGIVISQYPEPDSRRVMKNFPIEISLIVSLGKESATLPDLYGYDITEAASILRRMGAKTRVVYMTAQDGEDGKVIKSVPAKDSRIERGDRVTLYVTKTEHHPSVRVRDLIGLPLEEAAYLAMTDGLCVGEVEYMGESDGHGSYVVTDQSLAPDILVKYGTYIDLTVSETDDGYEVEEETREQSFFDRIKEFFSKDR